MPLSSTSSPTHTPLSVNGADVDTGAQPDTDLAHFPAHIPAGLGAVAVGKPVDHLREYRRVDCCYSAWTDTMTSGIPSHQKFKTSSVNWTDDVDVCGDATRPRVCTRIR